MLNNETVFAMPSSPKDFDPITVKKSKTQLTAKEIFNGLAISAVKIVASYDDEEYEIYIAEWVSSLIEKYPSVFKAKGGGDMGCDVMGFYGPAPSDRWDNYQCKHYKDPLGPADVTAEIVKLIYYVFIGEYLAPQGYFFVAPKGLSTQSLGLLRNATNFRARIVKDWDALSPDPNLKISDSKLRAFVDTFDLSIIKTIEPQNIIDQHAKTRWHARRFGGGLQPRPTPSTPPDELAPDEAVYVKELQDVYTEDNGVDIPLNAIPNSKYSEHFSKQRRSFYCAESLKLYARESLPDNGEFEDLQEQIFDGIYHVAESEHKNTLAKVNAVLGAVPAVVLNDHVLTAVIKPADRHGICHQLVNDKKLKWKK